MKSKIFSLFFLLVAIIAKSQTPFYKSYALPNGFISFGNSNFKHIDGSFTMAGITPLDSLGNFGINLFKVNSLGVIMNEKVIKENVIPDLPYSFIGQTFDKGCILALDKKVTKLDSLFNIQWSKQYTSATAINYGFTVQQTLDSGYVISTDFIDTSDFTINNLLIKLNNNGVLQWSSKFQIPNFSYRMKLNKQSSDGGFISCLNQEFLNTAIVKRNSLGQILWSKNIDLLNFYDLVETSNGDFILTGLKFNTFTSNSDAILIRINNLGNILWSKIYRTSTAFVAEQIELETNGDYLISGKVSKSANNINSNIFCLKTDNLGNIIWAKKYGDAAINSTVSGNIALSQTNSGGAFISYNHTTSTSDLFYTLNAIKTDNLGNISCSNFQYNLAINTIDTTYTSSNLTLLDTNIPITTSNNFALETIYPINTIDCSVIGFTPIDVINKFELFPNPTQGKFIIKIAPDHKINQIEVYDALGAKVYTSNHKNSVDFLQIDISDQPNGVYLLKILEENISYSSKIIMQ